mgnify:CR=1 FL=1
MLLRVHAGIGLFEQCKCIRAVIGEEGHAGAGGAHFAAAGAFERCEATTCQRPSRRT